MKGEPGGSIKADGLIADSYQRISEHLARRLVRWTLTDDAGDPYPQPWRNPAAIAALHTAEFWHVLGETYGEIGAQRKNGSSGTPTTSSATTQAPTQEATVSDPSPPKAS